MYCNEKTKDIASNKKLNIKDFPNLTKRDGEWLVRIQRNDKYEAIAIDYNLNHGTVRNRIKYIYAELYVYDRQGFFNQYGEYEIY